METRRFIALQRQKAITAYLKRKQLLPFSFAGQCGGRCWIPGNVSHPGSYPTLPTIPRHPGYQPGGRQRVVATPTAGGFRLPPQRPPASQFNIGMTRGRQRVYGGDTPWQEAVLLHLDERLIICLREFFILHHLIIESDSFLTIDPLEIAMFYVEILLVFSRKFGCFFIHKVELYKCILPEFHFSNKL